MNVELMYVARLMKSSGIRYPSCATYHTYQREILCPAVDFLWTEQRTMNLEECKTEEQVHLGGDARLVFC
jgi:hypothetical protein